MRYSNPMEIIAMVLIWAAALIWYDIAFNQKWFAPTVQQAQQFSHPELSMWIPYVQCTGQVEKVEQALKTISWLTELEIRRPQEAQAEEAQTRTPGEQERDVRCAVGASAKVTDIGAADFMVAYNALRNTGIVPETLEFGGIPHFAVRAQLSNFDCDSCVRAGIDALKAHKDPKLGSTFKWLDSTRVNRKEQTITAFVRYNNVVHIDEMIAALESVGLLPMSIHVVLE